MQHTRASVSLLAGLLALLAGAVVQAEPKPAPAAETKTVPAARKDRHALLVGCTKYPGLGEKFWLTGPGNDVIMVRDLLMKQFAFSPDQIMTLSEKEGETKGADRIPTRANIEREFKRLAKVAKAGEQVFIMLGGHGSQQPEGDNPDDPEPDGLDEIFLPRDAGQWDGGKGTVKNAIIDDEFGKWLGDIQATKASIFIVFDACHSGTMIRGADAEVARQVDPELGLGIKPAELETARLRAEKRNQAKPEKSRGAPEQTPPIKLANPGGIVAIYAAQPTEVTLERELPPRTKGAQTYGLLSFTMCQVLTQAAEHSAKPLTYRELAQRVHAQYINWGRTFPTPLIEGSDRDREVFGDKVWPNRSSITLAGGDEGLKINGGAMLGLTRGSILEVHPPAGQTDKLLGHVRIAEVRNLDADVEPCAFADQPAVKGLPPGSSCKLVFVDYGDQKLRVSVDTKDADDQPVSDADRKGLLKRLDDLGGEGSLVEVVADQRQADWLVRRRKTQILLVPAAGWAKSNDPVKSPQQFGPVPTDEQMVPWLKKRLERISRAENLKKLASNGQEEAARGGDQGPRVEVEIRRCRDASDRTGQVAVAWPSPNVTFYYGDRVIFVLRNKGRVPVDVTLLYVDSGYGIDCLFPKTKNNELNRLGPGEAMPVPTDPVAGTFGLEHVVVIAVKAEGQPVDFSSLEQPTIETAKARGGASRSLESPLGRLLQKGLYGEGKSRGMAREEIDDHTMSLLSWHVVPRKRPANEAGSAAPAAGSKK